MPADKGGHEGNASISDNLQKHLDGLKSNGRAHSEQAEREAYVKMQSQIDREKNREIRQFMQDTLEHYQDGYMLQTYLYEEVWYQAIKRQRVMQNEVQPIELYIALESILANKGDSSGYTKTSYQPRYPLTIPGNYSGWTRERNVDTNVPRVNFLNSYYKFGVHKFWVGSAIKSILDHLEKRYGLDFEELERVHQRAVKSKP